MPGLLVTHHFVSRFGPDLHAVLKGAEQAVELLVLDNEPGTVLETELLERVNLAFLSGDLLRGNFRGFFQTIRSAPNLNWLQVFYVGVDADRYGPLLERGVRLTNAAGASGEVIAQTAITGVLMLARGFPHWLEAQRHASWEPIAENGNAPRDLNCQTMVVVGVGAIGMQICRLGRALGLKVIGVRRTPGNGDEPVDGFVHPSELDSVLPAADWLALACPLTPETRGLIDERRLGLLPAGARLVNVSRGAVVDEEAMIHALESGRLAGAYLDVFAKEPLPPESPLWRLPNVIVTPHNAAVSSGKYDREARIFMENLDRWLKGEPLRNEILSF
jgi:D-2-hydroxyacid dehydrogenase (NADP+)